MPTPWMDGLMTCSPEFMLARDINSSIGGAGIAEDGGLRQLEGACRGKAGQLVQGVQRDAAGMEARPALMWNRVEDDPDIGRLDEGPKVVVHLYFIQPTEPLSSAECVTAVPLPDAWASGADVSRQPRRWRCRWRDRRRSSPARQGRPALPYCRQTRRRSRACRQCAMARTC